VLADRPFNTVLIGFGRIAAGYARDTRMARWFPYATHAQVLRAHPAYRWTAAVDPDPEARAVALRDWGVGEAVESVDFLADPASFDVAVLSTPPDIRTALLERLPSLKAVVVEKPIGSNVETAQAFLDACARRNIQVQVNFPRRGDAVMRQQAGSLTETIGRAQSAFVTYGNGLINNGSHIVDWVRMFLGEISSVRAVPEGPVISEGPIPGDTSFPFVLGLESGTCVMVQPLSFSNFRENSLDIWGERGRLSFWQEGLSVAYAPRAEHRFLEAHFEIASDRPEAGTTGQGNAIFELYENLAGAISSGEQLWSDGQGALRVMTIVDALKRSRVDNGNKVTV
jgi:predicted dehydrogenase